MRGALLAFACTWIGACGTTTPVTVDGDDTVSPDAEVAPDTPPFVDDDGDGIDDARELEIANASLPYISLAPDDGCARDGLLVRVRPHPQDPSKLLIVYDHLFETDCGLGGHTGDNEVFGVAIDPEIPSPLGILAIKAASHQGTPCQRISECSTCGSDTRSACDVAAYDGNLYPVVYASKDKHGQYATKGSCGFGTCLDSCSSNPTPDRPPIVNAGEPDHHAISDLTDQGFITDANGWTKPELLHFDPWGPDDFGGAGNIADDLVDPTFEAGVCP